VAFEIPDSRLTSEKELLAVSNLLREVGVALESVAETLADGTVEEGELENDNSQAGCRHSGMCLLEISPRRPLQEEKEETEALSQTEGSNLTSGRQPSGKIDSFSRALIFDLDGTLIDSKLDNLAAATMEVNRKKGIRILLMLLFLGTFDVHRRDWRALLRRMRLLRLGHKRQKTLVLRMK